MDRKTIIKLARKAGLAHFYDTEGHCTGITDARLVTEAKERNDDRLVQMLAPFAKLVAEHVIKDAPDYKMGYADGVAEEREQCAKVAENTDRMVLALLNVTSQPKHIAAAIRARGQHD